MRNKIIVAGGGHGGIAAAAMLAKEGFDVTVYERFKKNKLGYDWTDIFAPGALKIAGVGMPDSDKFCYKENMTFYSPNREIGHRQHVSRDQLEIKMERSDIYAHLINHAENCGVKFVYDCEIEAPIMLGNRVVGIKTSKGDYFASLVIDAAGIDSPLRTKLPSVCGIENTDGDFGRFYVYRAFYNRVDCDVKDNYKVYLLPQGKLGVGWVAAEEEYSDVLIGRFKPLSDDEIEESLEFLREDNGCLGDKLERGGQRVCIPVRHPLSVMVCDGYAAIGDSAFMTVPIIGSGIANSLKAARILADTVIADKTFSFSAETLWPYQRKFFKKLGASLAMLNCVKLVLTQLKPSELDYMFESGILTASDLTIGADSTSLTTMLDMNPQNLAIKAKALCKDPVLLKKILDTGVRIGRVATVCAALPVKWNSQQVMSWAKQYVRCFK